MSSMLRGPMPRISARSSQLRAVFVPICRRGCRSTPAGPSRRSSSSRWSRTSSVYVSRWRDLARARAGARGARRPAHVWSPAIALLFVALISPVDRLGEQLASVHMVQHLLIADLAPICLTLALTKHILRPATRRIHWLERAAGPFGHPAFGVVAYVGAMWLWHVPALYDAALEHAASTRSST